VTWSASDIPDLNGKTAIVTGGNVGLGYASSLALAQHGAHVVIACRSTEKGQQAIGRIKQQVPAASLDTIALDLIDQTSIASFAEVFNSRHETLDILMNNAGVVNLEQLSHSSDGLEMHMATNHFGHFALTAQLLPAILKSEAARVVTLSSAAANYGEIRFDDMNWHHRPYHRGKCYGDSKLANLLFMQQLQQQFEAAGSKAISVAAHPGLTGTERQQSIGMGGLLAKWLASPVSKGVRPQLMASTAPGVEGGDYYGPRFGLGGPPGKINKLPTAMTPDLAQKLWDFSVELTNTRAHWQQLGS
jgi:NAD(P)-dependent dehydrogenase (short-subunit alcohol dehydrogenase family)